MSSYQYFYRTNNCKAATAKAANCSCWYDEGTGPRGDVKYKLDCPEARRLTWREKVSASREPKDIDVSSVSLPTNLILKSLPDSTGSNLYEVSGFDADHPGGRGPLAGGKILLPFQAGPVPYKGTNGLTMEVLIEILCHRLEGFQSGPFACARNANALKHLNYARDELNLRTQERIEQGKEGTNKP